MGVEKDALRLNRAKSKVYTHTRGGAMLEAAVDFFSIAPRRSRFRARARARPKKVIVVERVSSGVEMRSIKLRFTCTFPCSS